MGKSAKVHPIEERGRNKGEVTRARSLSPWEEMERMFEDVFSRRGLRPFSMDWLSHGPGEWKLEGRVPAVDVIDREDELLVKAELPGVRKDELTITLTDDSVCIKGETREETRDEKDDYHRSEIITGAFSRTVRLPCSVSGDKAKAELKDGILSLHLPKLEKTRKTTVKID